VDFATPSGKRSRRTHFRYSALRAASEIQRVTETIAPRGMSGSTPRDLIALSSHREAPSVICPTGSFAELLSSPATKNILLVPSGKSAALSPAVSPR
jgi:hypothetical protein